MKKFKAFTFLLIVAMAFCLVSCGGNKTNSAAPAQSGSSAVAAPAQSAQAASAQPAVQNTTVVQKADPILNVSVIPASLKDLVAPEKSEVAEYKVYASKGSASKSATFSGLNGAFVLEEGDWTVYAEGFNADGVKVAETAKKTAKVSAGDASHVYLNAERVENGEGGLEVRIDVPEADRVKNVHISVRDTEAAKDEGPVKEFDLAKVQNWRRWDKFSGSADGIASGTYNVVADFVDSSNNYLYSRELGNTAVMGGMDSLNSHERIIPAPVFKIANNGDGSKKIDFEPDVYGSAVIYTDKNESELPDSRLHIEGERFKGAFDITETKEYRAVAVANDMVVSPVSKSGRVEILKAKVPTPDKAPGTYLYPEPANIKLSTVTPDCTIFYTVDGSEPGRNSIRYTGEGVNVEKGATIKAMAASLDGKYIDSDVGTYEYQVKALPPVSDHASGTYDSPFSAVLSNQTPGCNIYYTTDGSEPTTNSQKYNAPISVNRNMTIRAIAADNGYLPSDIAAWTYNVKSQVAIDADPKPGTGSMKDGAFPAPINVTLTAIGAPDADIYYTLNGAAPSTHSTKYTAPIYLDKETDIKAIAVVPGSIESDPSEWLKYQFQVATPTGDIDAGTIYSSNKRMTLSDATDGAAIHYSVDGGRMQDYTGPFPLLAGKHEVKAYATKAGWIDSDEAVFEYEAIRALDPPVIITPSGQYKNSVSTTMERTGMAETLNADIYYTTDNTVSDAEIATKGQKYNLGSTLTFDRGTTLRAVCVKDGYETSSVARARYDILVKDVAFSSVPIEEKPNIFRIEIECDTPGAVIYYTTDGSTPTTASTVYSGEFEVARGVEIQAFAEKEGCISSGVVSYTRKN